ncbi:MAG: methyltransferase domain-containing protein [Candidatus Latescibacteria bacterium]|nr:methyltransferase domain-containing protein [Candidatus Latescibacterota bacterium]
MSKSGSYNVNNFSTTSEGEIRRLNAQIDLFWEKEFAFYRKSGLVDGMNILDCGCGPGYLSEMLLGLLPKSKVTAVEMDSYLVKVASERLSGYIGEKRCSVIENSILKLDLPDNRFDFAVTRLVVEHVPDPLQACRELFRVLKPDGIVMVIDNDFEMHVRTYPPIPEQNDLYDAYCRARADEGGNPKIGRELPMILKKSGFSSIDLEILCAHSTILGDGPFLKSEGPGIPTQLVETGYFSGESYKKLIFRWHEMLKNNDHVIVRQLYAATGRKVTKVDIAAVSSAGDKKDDSNAEKNTGISSDPDNQSKHSDNDKIASLIDLIKSHVAKLLDRSTPEAISTDVALIDLGVDSEMSVDLQLSLSDALNLGKKLPSTLVFDYPSILSIARFIQKILESQEMAENVSDMLPAQQDTSVNKKESGIESLSDEEIEKKLLDKLDSYDREK